MSDLLTHADGTRRSRRVDTRKSHRHSLVTTPPPATTIGVAYAWDIPAWVVCPACNTSADSRHRQLGTGLSRPSEELLRVVWRRETHLSRLGRRYCQRRGFRGPGGIAQTCDQSVRLVPPGRIRPGSSAPCPSWPRSLSGHVVTAPPHSRIPLVPVLGARSYGVGRAGGVSH